MVDSPALGRLARLAAEMDVDRLGMSTRAAEVAGFLARWEREGALAREPLIVLAVNLHGWYTALETLLERVARLLDQSVPEGATWHADLIAQMRVELPSLRPVAIPERVVADVHALRKFRHFFRNAYVLDLDPAKVREHAERLRRVAGEIDASIGALRAHVQGVIDALARGG